MIVTGLLREIEMKIAEGWFGGSASREKKAVLQNAMTRVAMLDMDFAISAYLETAKEEKQTAMRKLADDFEGVRAGAGLDALTHEDALFSDSCAIWRPSCSSAGGASRPQLPI